MVTNAADVLIVGAGIGGLTCGRTLSQQGIKVQILEQNERVGGRLQTDTVDGYRFDHGFQVLQLAYPAAQEILDYDRLELKIYPPGARIWDGGRMHLVADPRRRPDLLWSTLSADIGTLADRLRLVRLVLSLRSRGVRDIFLQPGDRFAREFLEDYGFSPTMIDRFFVPFFTGVCLDPNIRVSERFLKFVLLMFASGDVAVPAGGMGDIPRQLAESVDGALIRCGARVEAINGTTVILASGEQLQARAVVVATAAPAADHLLGRGQTSASCGETCFYYASDQPPVDTPFLTLNGSGSGLVNSVNFPSMVAPDCAPAGQYLISAVVPGSPARDPAALEGEVRGELRQWFGPGVSSWRYLRHYLIEHALTRPEPPVADPYTIEPHLGGGVFDCSESRSLPAIQWAMLAGQQTAQAVSRYLAGG